MGGGEAKESQAGVNGPWVLKSQNSLIFHVRHLFNSNYYPGKSFLSLPLKQNS
jgi:hypothetical protein